MPPAVALAAFDRALARTGERVILRRINPAPAPPTDVTVRARVTGYRPEELVGGITQGHRKVILSAADVAASGFPLPIRKGSADRIVVRGQAMTPQAIDDSTRRIGDTLIAYEIQALG